MSDRIVMLGAGAVGGYVGGHLSAHGHDVTLVDSWHDNIEAIRSRGLELSGMTEEERRLARPNTLHLHEVASLARQKPVDIAFLCVKSYDTEWMSQLIKPYLAPGGFVVSLQNCLNEERIAEIVGWGRTLGCIAARISVELFEPGRIRRQAPKGAAEHIVFRVGEVHGRVTDRAKRITEMLSVVDGAKVTTNLWGERWSKLCHNAMRNGISAATGLSGREIDQHDDIRRLTINIGGEAVRIGMALGYELEKIGKLEPKKLVRAADGDADALAEVDATLVGESSGGGRGKQQRPSMGQDMLKGRRTEIDFINGYIVEKGAQIGIAAPHNARIASIVKRVERQELPIAISNLREE
ncbi:2-dehydropantoate 2-reductase [Bradyrhizobium sp. LHD-71]|uniref:ketopantoate reductase family protein n=1 Tax=Bradyrhizobium sp. LHD-71 TaxID=3072141 RepID=UPI00280D92A1|nr:2-dehydropantoate 2-reductase [Bradyrhizobium sp. LHD-71]MDQ8729208.1 2-dehydropantoate 2-reductase [Bradyrhizobium sp. LHD-71]